MILLEQLETTGFAKGVLPAELPQLRQEQVRRGSLSRHCFAEASLQPSAAGSATGGDVMSVKMVRAFVWASEVSVLLYVFLERFFLFSLTRGLTSQNPPLGG